MFPVTSVVLLLMVQFAASFHMYSNFPRNERRAMPMDMLDETAGFGKRSFNQLLDATAGFGKRGGFSLLDTTAGFGKRGGYYPLLDETAGFGRK